MLAHGLLLPLGSRAELHQTTTLSPAVPPWSLSLRGAAQGADVAAPAPANLWPLQVEAGMLVHRAARKVSPTLTPTPTPNLTPTLTLTLTPTLTLYPNQGLITFQLAVPFYGLAVLPLLTVLPMGCLFWWRQADISFWSFLFI